MRALATFTVHQADPSCHMSVLCFAHGPTALLWMAREPPCVITSRRNEIYQSFVPVCVEVLHRERAKLYICLDGEQSKEEETGGWVCCHQHGSGINTDYDITKGWRPFGAKPWWILVNMGLKIFILIFSQQRFSSQKLLFVYFRLFVCLLFPLEVNWSHDPVCHVR